MKGGRLHRPEPPQTHLAMAAAVAAPPIPAPNHTPLPSSLTSSRPHSQLKELSRNREPHHRIRSSRVAGMVVAELTMTARWCRTPHRRRHRANDGEQGFSRDAGLAMEAIHSLSASKSSYPMVDLTQLFMTATQERKRLESQGQILRVICTSMGTRRH
uniref:Uncharacterized protein n=1 Tax=Zea mays TaxID=4577 RepID=A0A804QVU5_MAIZE